MEYLIAKKGVIKGGTASYSVDAAGNIAYQLDVVVGFLFLTKTISKGGTYHVDPALLDPERIKVGMVISVGQLDVTVVGIDPVGNFDCNLALNGTDFTGTAILEPSSPAVTPQSLDAKGHYDGFDLELSVNQSRGIARYLPEIAESAWSRAVGVAMRIAETVRLAATTLHGKK